jgi:predicted GNAT family acetyltransferase
MPAFSTNDALARFEMVEAGAVVSFATFRLQGDVLAIEHVETPPEARGRGFAEQLMTHVVSLAAERNLQIDPRCPFASAFMKRHGEVGELDRDAPARGVIFPGQPAPEPNEPA